MNKHRWNRIFSGIVAVLAALMLFACTTGGGDALNTDMQTTEAPQNTSEPMTGESGVSDENTEDRLADGTYPAAIYSNLKTDDSGRTWAMVSVLQYEEIPDSEIKKVRVSDSVQLHDYSFVVRTVELREENGVREILFNGGTESCVYVPETNTWRFISLNGEPYTYEDRQYVMPFAVDATYTDELTPFAEGRNVYGMPDDGDPTIGMLDELGDYFRHYPGLEYEYMTITVRDGEITDVLIEYRP